ncbi:leucine Rich repeat-containing domain protein, partial [human gut metagenome]
IGANIFNDYDANSLTAAKKNSMRHDYENKFLKYDPRANMSEMIVKSYNSDPKVAPKNRIKKDSRINLKDAQIGTLTNKITGVSKAIYRLTKLQQFYIGNSSITEDGVLRSSTMLTILFTVSLRRSLRKRIGTRWKT